MTSEEKVLATAEMHVRTGGYKGFSFRHIARDTGLTSAGVHHHFPTKADLVARLADEYTSRFLDAVDACPIEDRVECLRDLFAESLSQDGKMCLCGLLAAESGGLPKNVAEAARAFLQQLADRLQPAFADSDNSRSKALGVLSQLEGAAMLATAFADPGVFLSATRNLVRTD
ncbi:MAG: TetR/AcrR family transcriptional regulator [Pseudomonadota bacterium]